MIRSRFEEVCILTNTRNDVVAEAEVGNFRHKERLDAYLVANKIPMIWNGRIYVGNMLGMEFTTPGPVEHTYKD